jgi:biotin carboxyl carrier protein
MRYFVRVGDTEHEVSIDGDVVTIDGKSEHARLEDVDGTPIRLVTVGDRRIAVIARRGEERGSYDLSLAGYRLAVEAITERARAIRALSRETRKAGGASKLVAPMPGLIVRIAVAEGDEVRAGQGLVVMEAMKMENELRIASAGRVKRIHVSPGTAVERGATLLELE